MLPLLASDYHLCLDAGLTDATLRRIDEAINQDVEMQASYLSQTWHRSG